MIKIPYDNLFILFDKEVNTIEKHTKAKEYFR